MPTKLTLLQAPEEGPQLHILLVATMAGVRSKMPTWADINDDEDITRFSDSWYPYEGGEHALPNMNVLYYRYGTSPPNVLLLEHK